MLSKFIDSLNVRLTSADFREVLKPFSVTGHVEKHNLIVLVNQGHMRLKGESKYAEPGSFYFFPAGKSINIEHGSGPYEVLELSSIGDESRTGKYFRKVDPKENISDFRELITMVRFDVQLYDIIPFFETLDIPVFGMPANEELGYLIKHLALEQPSNRIGHQKLLSNQMEELIIHICRHIETQAEFKASVDKLGFLADRRLVDIVKYISENLDKDLSNKTIANLAYISEDYVGQFFKSLTGKNLQDYIENQRLEKALFLLKTLPDNIQEIAHKVGFKDPAYFSRRFKMKYGSNANSVRQNKVQLA